MLKTPAGRVNVFNLQGVWDLDGDNFSDRRKRMSEVIITATRYLRNVLIAGDTNSRSTNQAMKNVEQYLKPVFSAELETTFNMKHKQKPGYATSVVDLMYVSKDVEVVSHECRDIDVSDHLPLLATVSFKQEA